VDRPGLSRELAQFNDHRFIYSAQALWSRFPSDWGAEELIFVGGMAMTGLLLLMAKNAWRRSAEAEGHPAYIRAMQDSGREDSWRIQNPILKAGGDESGEAVGTSSATNPTRARVASSPPVAPQAAPVVAESSGQGKLTPAEEEAAYADIAAENERAGSRKIR